jgi:hypothetical protein
MDRRHTSEHLDAWRRDGGLVMENFFTPDEVAAVVADFEQLFGRQGGAAPLVKRRGDDPGSFHASQFETIRAVPLDCSPALNLVGVHPALIAFAKDALQTDDVHVYQCQAWAKFTGAADYDQPYHCDYLNHTLTAPSDDDRQNALTIMCYFTDVTEAHGPTQYVAKPDSDPIAPPEATLAYGGEALRERNRRLEAHTRTAVAPAGSIFPYTIDVYHRGRNLTAPGGYRYTVTTCFKRAGNDAISFYAWAFHHTEPWARIFDHASPEQLACFGVPRPGDRFWTETTIARTQARYPGWNAAPYREALAS